MFSFESLEQIKMIKMNMKVHPSGISARSNHVSKSNQKMKNKKKFKNNKKNIEQPAGGKLPHFRPATFTKKCKKNKKNKKIIKRKNNKKYKKLKNQKIRGKTKGAILLCFFLLIQSIVPQFESGSNENTKNQKKQKNENTQKKYKTKNTQKNEQNQKTKNVMNVDLLEMHNTLEVHMSTQHSGHYAFSFYDDIYKHTAINKYTDNTGTLIFWDKGHFTKVMSGDYWVKYKMFSLSNKKMNKNQKIKNGNGNISVGHWNAGSKHWHRKREDVELLLAEKNYDLLFVSESNLFSTNS